MGRRAAANRPGKGWAVAAPGQSGHCRLYQATAEDTEHRLLNALRKRSPDLPKDLDLTITISALRQGQGLKPGVKVYRVGPIRAVATCETRRREYRTCSGPPAVRRRSRAMHRPGARRLLAGREPIHA